MPVNVQCPNPECHTTISLTSGEATRFRRCPECDTELNSPGDFPETAPDHSPPAWPSMLVEGATFAGRYRIIRVLGRGGMGRVYLAHDSVLDRDVALKVPILDSSPSSRGRFRREAKAAARLHHPNICPIFDVGEHDGQLYLTMAHIGGKTLAEHLKGRSEPFHPTEAVALVRTLALAIQEAHEAGVIHRDLKPSNIMLTRESRPVVMDFGLARHDDPSDTLRTRSGQPMGTPAYMPLEQHRGDLHAIGPSSDVYSLGVVLYQLLTGRLPFEGNPGAVFEKLLTSSPPSPLALRQGLDPGLVAVCLKAMAREAGDRYASMKDFAVALEACLAPSPDAVRVGSNGSDVGSGMPATPKPSGLSDAPTGGRRIGLAVAGLVLASLLGAIVYILTDKGTVKITGADPTMTVEIDGDAIEITRLGEPISLRVGSHQLRVTRGDLVVTADRFRIERGREIALEVEFIPKASESKPIGRMKAGTGPKELTSSTVGLKLVRIEPGEFLMGSDGGEAIENPRHRVRITKVFYLGATEVTVGQFRLFVDAEAYRTEAERDGMSGYGFDQTSGKFEQSAKFSWKSPGFAQTDEHPVGNVSWNDAVAFCEWLNRKEGFGRKTKLDGDTITLIEGEGYRLPTEAEWEYACRAGTTTEYWTGDDPEGLADAGNIADGTAKEQYPGWATITAKDGFVLAAPVGRFRPNPWGLHDMHGNAWEWCADGYDANYYQKSPSSDPFCSHGPLRVGHGGDWSYPPYYARSATRTGSTSWHWASSLGFRVARVLSGR